MDCWALFSALNGLIGHYWALFGHCVGTARALRGQCVETLWALIFSARGNNLLVPNAHGHYVLFFRILVYNYIYWALISTAWALLGTFKCPQWALMGTACVLCGHCVGTVWALLYSAHGYYILVPMGT